MIKDKVGRQRYILFSVDGSATRTDVIHAINNFYRKTHDDEDVPWLTVYEKNYGIVRCKHTKKEDVINLLNSLKIKNDSVKTIKASGTIKKLKEYISNS